MPQKGLSHYFVRHQKGAETATCDKAGAPNDVCPYGQVMSASPNDVAYGNDVCLRHSGQTSHHCDHREQHHYERSE
jgi:hypothetical protein